MLIYLPIAELSVNMFIVFGMGGAVGFLSGLFGVGGGFLLTPLLIFSGIPPVVSVASVAPQIVAASTSAALSYWRRQLIDMKLAGVLTIAGIVGSALGFWLAGLAGIAASGGILRFVIAIAGAALLIFVLSLLGIFRRG